MNFGKTILACVIGGVIGGVIMFVVWLMMIIGIIGSFSTTVAPVVEKESILVIDLNEAIVDSPVIDPMSGFDPMSMSLESTSQLSLMTVMRALEAAAEDDRIEGIYLRMDKVSSPMDISILEELRNEILRFKESGKFVVAYNERYSQGLYYLATTADQIYIQPEGSMDWAGLSNAVMFYKGLIDKLGVQAEIFRPTSCRFKSAVEPFMYEKMSPENRQQVQLLINTIWKTICEGVAESRDITVDELNRLADELAVALPQEALEHHFVDGILYEDQMEEIFTELGVELFDGKLRMVTLGDYAAAYANPIVGFGSSQIALVYAQGEIVDGEGEGGQIYGHTLAAKIREVREDENIKAVILRVNSPGGSALASDIIWREMELLKAEKPVIVSMGAYAASGGYYISAPADVIVADKMTLTGSIGVFGMMMNYYNALDKKLGVTVDAVKTNKSAGMGQTGVITPTQRAAMMRGVDRVYKTFTGHVADGRNLPIERVLEIAEGRVWSGVDALERGLVDANGGLRLAIAIAADKANLGDDYVVVEKGEEPSGFAAIFAALSGQVKASAGESALNDVMYEYRAIKEALSQQGVVMYSPYRLIVE